MEEIQFEESEKGRKMAWMLSLAGFLPFLLIAVFLLYVGSMHPMFGPVFDSFKVWSAIILSFLGGIRWGIAVSSKPVGSIDLLASVLPSIAGWLAVLMPDKLCLLVLLLCYSGQGAWDSLSLRQNLSLVWFARLRIALTFLVAGAHLVVILAYLGT